MGFAEADLTHDAFLGGRVHAWQPKHGYRAATDPVLLAASVPARPGDDVLELGCGVGVASLCLAARVTDLDIIGVERQAEYAELAARNGLNVVTADLTDLPDALRNQGFDQVIANPPYYAKGAGTAAADSGREQALREDTPLEQWIDVASRRLKPKGWLTMIQSADRLPEMLAALHPRLGSLSLLPVMAREGRPAGRVLLRARKGGRTPFRLLPPLIMHNGAAHKSDGEDYTQQIRAVLRDGESLEWG